MLLDRPLQKLLQPDSKKISPNLNLYMQYLGQQEQKVLQRYPTGRTTTSMLTLQHVLSVSDWKELLTIASFDQRLRYLTNRYQELQMVFYQTAKGGINQSEFVKAPKPVAEILLPVKADDPYQAYPSSMDWNEWKTYPPLRMVVNDSPELSYLSYQDVLIYKIASPQVVVFTLDLIALVLKWCSYQQWIQTQTVDLSVEDYLHNQVVFPCLVKDSTDLWLLRNYTELMKTPDLTIQKNLDLVIINRAQQARIGAAYYNAMRDIQRFIQQLQSNALDLSRFFQSLCLVDGQSIASWFSTLQTTTTLPDERQYLWAEVLKRFNIMTMALIGLTLSPPQPQNQFIISYLLYDVQLLIANKPWNNVHHSGISQLVETTLLQWSVMLKQLKNGS